MNKRLTHVSERDSTHVRATNCVWVKIPLLAQLSPPPPLLPSLLFVFLSWSLHSCLIFSSVSRSFFKHSPSASTPSCSIFCVTASSFSWCILSRTISSISVLNYVLSACCAFAGISAFYTLSTAVSGMAFHATNSYAFCCCCWCNGPPVTVQCCLITIASTVTSGAMLLSPMPKNSTSPAFVIASMDECPQVTAVSKVSPTDLATRRTLSTDMPCFSV